MHLLAFAQIFLINSGERIMANLSGYGLDLLDQRQRRCTEGYPLGTTILGRSLAVYQALRFQAIEQTSKSRPLYRNALRQLSLGRLVIETSKMQKNQPARLGKAKISETSIQLCAPATRQLSQLHGEAMLLGVHVRPFLQKN